MNDLNQELFERMKDLNGVSMAGYQAGKAAGYQEGFRAGVKACKKEGLNLNITQTYAAAISPLGKDEPCNYACTDDNYEPGAPIGYGRTECEAAHAYFLEVEEREEAEAQTEENMILKTEDPQTGVLE